MNALKKFLLMYVFKLSGHSGFLWPGLNVPLMRDGAVQTIAQRSKEEQEKVEANMFQQREEWDRKKKMKVKRERGWSGNSWGGVSLGPPDPGPNGGSRVLILLTFETERLLEVLEFLNMSLFTYLFRLLFSPPKRGGGLGLNIIEITLHYYPAVFYGTIEAHNQKYSTRRMQSTGFRHCYCVVSQSLTFGGMLYGSAQQLPNTTGRGVSMEQHGVGVSIIG